MKRVLLLLFVLVCVIAEQPYQVRLSLTGRIDERVVMWTSTTSAAGSVMYWQESAPAAILQDTSSVSTYSYPGYSIPYFHTATLRNLIKNTTYFYQVSTDGVWSPNYTFTTENTPDEMSPFKILMMGDMSTSSAAQEVVTRIGILKSEQEIDFVLYAGDLSYANGDQPYWDTWQSMIQGLTSDIPWMFSVGNHEHENGAFTAFQTRFSMPANSSLATEGNLYYSYNYENVHVIALNSEDSSFVSTAQRTWLESDLASVNRTRTPWVFATWHKPWYCTNQAHYLEAEQMRTQLEPLLYQYGVDVILNGHVHAYERTTNIYNNNPTSNGIVYLNVGSAGQNLHTAWNAPTSWSVYRNATHGVGMMTIFNSTHLYWEFVAPDGSVPDSTWILKSTVTPSISPTPTVTPTLSPSPTRTPSVTPSASTSSSVTPSINSSPSNSPSGVPTSDSSSEDKSRDTQGWIVFSVILVLAGVACAGICSVVYFRNRKKTQPTHDVLLPEIEHH